jgi:hypothetical protein
MRTCEVEGCENPHSSKGMCVTHYMRVRRNGSPEKVSRIVGGTAEQRFWTYVRKTETCWLWTGATSHGYGHFHLNAEGGINHQVRAHRFSYELLIGPIPAGMTLDHMCHTLDCKVPVAECPHRRCVNPAHLAPASLADNTRRTGARHKTHCKRGHEFTPENTWVFVSSVGGPGRMCKTCSLMHGAARRARIRAAKSLVDSPNSP